MNKEQFISSLRARLAYLPPEETEKFIAFYAESIDDRIEDGMSEQDAVAAMGDIESAAHAIEAELPLSTIVKQRVRDSRERSGRGGGSAVWIVLAVLGSPIWLSLLCVLVAVVVAVYAVAIALAATAYALLLAFGLSSICIFIYGVSRLFAAGLFAALLCLGMALVLAGLTAVLLWPCVWLTKQLLKLPLRLWRWVKGLFIGRRRNDR